jgi:fatty acid/phospholipid biosynthesis enzyme
MKTIIVDVPGGLDNTVALLSALKVFAKKNKLYSLLVVGSKNDISVLEDTEGIECYYPEGLASSTAEAIVKLKSTSCVGLISFAKRKKLLDVAMDSFGKKVSPSFGLSYQTKEIGKESLLIDAGGYGEMTFENLDSYLSYGTDYLTNILKATAPSSALLAVEDAHSQIEEDFAKSQKAKNPNFRGFISPEDLFESGISIIVAGGTVGATAVSSAKGVLRIKNEIVGIENDKSFHYKIGESLSKGARESAEFRFCSSVDQNGYLLFGFGQNILSLDKNGRYGDLLNALSTLQRIERNRPALGSN